MDADEYRRMAAAEEGHWWYAATRALLRQLLAPHLAPGMRVLDAGCGTGAAGGWLGGAHRLVGIDPQALALALHRERRPSAALVRAGIAEPPFAAGAFDAALAVTVLYHEGVADPAEAVCALAGAVRPGGVVCLLEPGIRRLRRGHDRVTRTARRFSRRDLRALLAGAGLEVLRVTGAYAFLVPAAAAKALAEAGRSTSDLGGAGRASGAAAALAAAERRWLLRHDLPFGLSVVGIGRRPAAGSADQAGVAAPQ